MRQFVFLVPVLFVFACQNTPEIAKSSDDSELENVDSSRIFTDSVFTGGIEGPAVNSKMDLFAVNFQEEGTIGWLKTGASQFETFVKLSNGSIGNGIRFDQKGNMFIADYVNHNVLMIENGTKQISVFAHNDSMNQPNDLAIMDNGILFASDPNWGEKTGQLWRVNLKGKIFLLESGMGTTNGVEVSPDQKTLYVNESVQLKIWAYDIDSEGEVSNKREFISFNDGGMDGMRCDTKGNLYVARYGTGKVIVINPSGDIIREVILHGRNPTNVAFGGKNGKTVFVTMQSKKWIETFEAEHKGRAVQY